MHSSLRSSLACLCIALYIFGCEANSITPITNATSPPSTTEFQPISIGGLSREELDAVRSKKAAVVFLQVNFVSVDKGAPPFRIRVVKIGGVINKFQGISQEKSPTEKLNALGWRYLVLSPGSYLLFIRTAFLKPKNNQKYFARLKVPPSGSLFYAGSIRCGNSRDRACGAVMERKKDAEWIAKTAFLEQGPLKTNLMHPHYAPVEESFLLELQPVAVSISTKNIFVPHDWEKWLQDIEANISPVETHVVQDPFIGLLVGIAIAAIAGAAKRDREMETAFEIKQKWEKCIRQIEAASTKFNFADDMRARITERLAQKGIYSIPIILDENESLKAARQAKAKSLLQIEIQGIKLVPYIYDAVKISSSYRARLFDAEAGETVYERELGYSHQIDPKAYCSEGEAELVRKGFARELEIVVDHVLPLLPSDNNKEKHHP